ncbi:hypothetical protein BD311DRAFT_766256 [Dichomitus squalens]|uniref:Uncharacterized protein n=1 Tax=Dichomitus squalens TaxID=114155 RepID=A0A4Q9MDG5_9APHY|nr:hypothetical protein BD311DRAFT_766256 [Dichomitus squalens]
MITRGPISRRGKASDSHSQILTAYLVCCCSILNMSAHLWSERSEHARQNCTTSMSILKAPVDSETSKVKLYDFLPEAGLLRATRHIHYFRPGHSSCRVTYRHTNSEASGWVVEPGEHPHQKLSESTEVAPGKAVCVVYQAKRGLCEANSRSSSVRRKHFLMVGGVVD